MESIMPSNLPNLKPETLDAFIASVHADPDLKARVIESLRSQGLAGTVTQFFTVSDRQTANLALHSNANESSKRSVIDTMIATLETGGKITLRNEPAASVQGFSASGHFGNDGVDFSVNCEL
jgi:hypothetical protein